eukprot:TRINITY_DN932_c0_g1_i6.p1 TRINITY_DN932_c0_g1~~TRINITY_DN932_c0_g1_i6.p1  ORF type:complete len:357 (+),score=67.17 TRINITY_DN932_c0_g1_i6:99-1073(+)
MNKALIAILFFVVFCFQAEAGYFVTLIYQTGTNCGSLNIASVGLTDVCANSAITTCNSTHVFSGSQCDCAAGTCGFVSTYEKGACTFGLLAYDCYETEAELRTAYEGYLFLETHSGLECQNLTGGVLYDSGKACNGGWEVDCNNAAGPSSTWCNNRTDPNDRCNDCTGEIQPLADECSNFPIPPVSPTNQTNTTVPPTTVVTTSARYSCPGRTSAPTQAPTTAPPTTQPPTTQPPTETAAPVTDTPTGAVVVPTAAGTPVTNSPPVTAAPVAPVAPRAPVAPTTRAPVATSAPTTTAPVEPPSSSTKIFVSFGLFVLAFIMSIF